MSTRSIATLIGYIPGDIRPRPGVSQLLLSTASRNPLRAGAVFQRNIRNMTKSSREKYTDPGLRDQLKEEIQAGDKGGKPGQWSARKVGIIIFIIL